ncbi:hypothetical protein MASR2M78_15890 [Treponema sp.]
MRGAAFLGGEGPSPSLGREILGSFDLVVSADSGLLLAEKWAYVSDYIVGDMDSLGDMARLERYPASHIISYPVDKDYTDTELAIELLHEKHCDEVVLLGGGRGRIDHLLAIAALFERDKAPQRWITAAEDLRLLDASSPTSSSLAINVASNQAAPALFSIFPLGSGPWKVRSQGLKWPLDALSWKRGFFGISNVAVSETISLKAEQGRFLAVLALSSVSFVQGGSKGLR